MLSNLGPSSFTIFISDALSFCKNQVFVYTDDLKLTKTVADVKKNTKMCKCINGNKKEKGAILIYNEKKTMEFTSLKLT